LLLALARKNALEGASNHPTPQCVSQVFLSEYAVAPDSFSLDDARVEHVVKCAYCFPRLLDLRSQKAIRRAPRLRIALIVAACIVCLTAGIALVRFWYPAQVRLHNSAVAVVTLNLTDYGTLRGTNPEPSVPQTALVLPASRIDLTLILPRFSDAGAYSLSISANRQSEHSLASGRSTAVPHGDQMVLRIPLDLSAMRPGDYVLSTELDGDGGANYYPVRIQ